MFVFFVLAFAFRSLIANIGTHLLDWNDYPFYVWTIFQNINHFKAFTPEGFFDTNIFFPYRGTLLFSDLLLPQSLIALPLSYFTENHVLVFNILFFLTLLLNVGAVYFFWKQIFRNQTQLLFSTFATNVSGLVFQNSVHFQFLGFWPFFFGLGYLVKPQKTVRDVVLLGMWVGIQFLAGVYLSIFLMCAVGIWYALVFLHRWRQKKALHQLGKELTVMGAIFLTVAGIFLYKYIQVKKMYGITREFWEYVRYSAHLTDYVFTTNYSSVVSRLPGIALWNSFNRAGSLFPGFLLSGFALAGIFAFRKIRQGYQFTLRLSETDLFFFTILLGGFIASLGPRLNVNGSYAILPLPYHVLLKLLPLLEPIRVTSRWYIFVLIALIYFAGKGMKKFSSFTRTPAIIGCCFIVALEVLPIFRVTEAKQYYHPAYGLIEESCAAQPKVLLEYPMTQDLPEANIVTNLTYRTQAMLASLRHGCLLVNGYMGYSPKDYDRYESQLTTSVNQGDEQTFWRLLAEKDVSFFKLNKRDILAHKAATAAGMIRTNQVSRILLETDEFFLVSLEHD